MSIKHRLEMSRRLLAPLTGLPEPERTIEPPETGLLGHLQQVWAYRRLVPFFVARAVTYRSKRALFGWFWLVLRSLLWVLPFSFVVGKVAGTNADDVPYPLFILVGMSLWNFFTSAVSFMTRCRSFDRDVIEQLGIPPMIVVFSSLGLVVLELLFGTALVYAIGAAYSLKHGTLYLALNGTTFLSLGFVALTSLLALGIGMVCSVFDEYATDTRFLIPYLLSFAMLVTPVIYPLSAVPEKWHFLICLNPMAVIVEGFRKAILDAGHLDAPSLLWAVASSVATFLAGCWFFVRATGHADRRA